MVAASANNSISADEIPQNVIKSNSRIPVLINNQNEHAPGKKLAATISPRKTKENCEQVFIEPRNRTLDRFKFYSKQKTNDNGHFWHTSQE